MHASERAESTRLSRTPRSKVPCVRSSNSMTPIYGQARRVTQHEINMLPVMRLNAACRPLRLGLAAGRTRSASLTLAKTS